MSGYVSGLVWRAKIPGATLTEKAILALYADIGDESGSNIFPSKRTVAERSQSSHATVKRATSWAIRAGLLRVVKASEGGARKSTTQYAIDVATLRALAGDAGDGIFQAATDRILSALNQPEGAHPEPGNQRTRLTVNPVQGEPGSHSTHEGAHCEPQYVTERKRLSNDNLTAGKNRKTGKQLPDDFLLFWQAATPTMRKRSAARHLVAAEWRRACETETPDRLLSALRRYVAEDSDVRADRGQPALERWLRAGRWDAWLATPSEAGPQIAASVPRTAWLAAIRQHEATGRWPAYLGPPPGAPDHAQPKLEG